jgi:hypothetical protein
MPYATSIHSYPDVRQLFDQALESEKGLRLTFETEAQAITNAGRFNAFRVRDRKENAKTYPADHTMHGRSPYDGLMVQRQGPIVIVKKLDVAHFNIEELK